MEARRKRISIADVAREAGVSKTSVSNYLNGRKARLAEATIARIRETVERLNYNPSLGARRLSSQAASRSIAAIIRHDLGYAFDSAFFPQVMKGIGDACAALGYRILVVASMGRSVREDIDYALSLGRGIVDGFLLFELEEDDPYIRAFERSGVPYVCFGRPDDPAVTRWVASDQEGGIAAAVDHLWTHGRRRIALFPGRAGLMVTKLRVEGFRRSLAARGGVWDESLVQYGFAPGVDAYPVFSRLLAEPGGPDAYLIRQVDAAAFARALRERKASALRAGAALRTGAVPRFGDSVPTGDFPVAASDAASAEPAVVLADFFPPEGGAGSADEGGLDGRPYTYVRSHARHVGFRGASRLIDLVRGVENETSELFPTELVVGATCGCTRPEPAEYR